MKKSPVLIVGALFVAGVAFAQLRITSFNSDGELTWTNSIYRGLYGVESASTPVGPWNLFGAVIDLDGTKTNRISLQVPVTNLAAFYRVAWSQPNPIGVWDYRGYDNQGTLVITGQLSLPAMSLVTSNPPVVYGIQGSWTLDYVGPPTNDLYWLGPQIGTGSLVGTLTFHSSDLDLFWPTNPSPGETDIKLWGDLWANTYTGRWANIGFVPLGVGRFTASRMPATNEVNLRPAREVGNNRDNPE